LAQARTLKASKYLLASKIATTVHFL